MNSIVVAPSKEAAKSLPPSAVELNLLLDWQTGETRSRWAAVLAASLVLHLVLFFVGIRIPNLLGQYRRPERTVVMHRIPLYLPRDVMTQKAPNTQKVAKQIDLADLEEQKASRPGGQKRPPSVRQFQIPKQAPVKQVSRNEPPKILPDAPTIAPNQTAAPAAGLPNGLPATPPPPQKQEAEAGPFQNIGSENPPPNPHPTLAPPKSGLEGATREFHQQANGDHLAMSDDAPERGAPGGIGVPAQAPAQHAAVELQSDPSGADFKIYLRTILAIVRANWRRVIPESARMGTLRGRTVVEFIIDRDGSIPKLVTADSSGSEPLDRAAVAGLSMSNPLPPLPTDYKGFQVRLAFTFAYNMPAK